MGEEVDEVMEGDEKTPPPWIDERTCGDAVRHSYSLRPTMYSNSAATTLSEVRGNEWTLQPDLTDWMLKATVRPSWVALTAGRAALRDLVHAADEHPMEFPDADPDFSEDELNPRTRQW